ncbi:flagellar filament capping protein FliD [Pragia fontium]|uniref:Flagellar hook-associated protein 2 n=2 Tax=Pragia fontium TaxID=82985 RepID=A0AAJ5BFQ8_9GAMM|nr:flagellar filament capping protein FliD [Pragia fontium]AKJ41400.1 flagellar hook-associated protein [Pragia fontium]SFC00841.1 flagellar hook-associated protein 2 [Pragia fontium DSM 5563 = ATCC 49100]SUB81652.1 Flagellar cap protein [Pragia fontium]VEJ54141.1 Flagellar cap protein [Pragia fontium]GKX62959.1 lateral flagellar hook-associated protein 2 [Pragia fontium]
MSDFLNLDPQGTAEKLAYYDILTMKTQLVSQQKQLASQQAALKSLRTSLSDFRTAMNDLNKTNNGMLQTSAKASVEGMANITTNSNAAKGNYSFFVSQLASAHQSALTNITDDDIANGSGTLSLSMNGKQLDIDMTDINSIEELAVAINGNDDNPGMTASVIRSNGEISLMLSSDETGAKNQIDVTMSGSAFVNAQETEITKAQDAEVWIGEEGKGIKVTNDSNTFTNLIQGVTLEFNQASKPGDAALRINVGTDDTVTKEKMQSFIDAYNKLATDLGTLTKSGGNRSDRGPFAGDSGIMALERQLNSIIRADFGGHQLTEFGITADREGKLKLDSDKFSKLLKSEPAALTNFFNGNDGLIKGVDKLMDGYLSSSKGELKMRQETLDRKESQLTDREALIETRYNTSYSRYLKQFSQLQKVMAQMNSTLSMFTTTK